MRERITRLVAESGPSSELASPETIIRKVTEPRDRSVTSANPAAASAHGAQMALHALAHMQQQPAVVPPPPPPHAGMFMNMLRACLDV